MLVQIDSKFRRLNMNWVVTSAALSQDARGATTEIFAPVQGFFQVANVADLQITVSSSGAVSCTTLCMLRDQAPSLW